MGDGKAWGGKTAGEEGSLPVVRITPGSLSARSARGEGENEGGMERKGISGGTICWK